MTTKQLTKLETRITALKAAKRIVWIEGIDATQIKGKIAGKPCYFVKAESLNANGGHWYYIVRWEQVEWLCSCESNKPCKHETALQTRINAMVVKQRKTQEFQKMLEQFDVRHQDLKTTSPYSPVDARINREMFYDSRFA